MSWLYSIVFAGLLFSSGSESISISTNQNTDESVVLSSQQDVVDRFEQTYPLNANGRVSVSNVNGSITVSAWDRKEVRLVAIKTADSKERLADVQIQIDSKPEYLRVETEHSDWKWKEKDKDKPGGEWRNNGKLTVDYELSIPRTAMLNEIETVNGSVTVSDFVNFTKISAVNGSVKATNLRGTANLSTVNGEVAADFEQLEPSSRISLETVNGKVNLVIPSDANATVKADSLNGTITNDFGLPVRKGKYIGRDLYGRIGSGDVTIKLESVNGGLSVKRRNDGRTLSPATNLLPAKADDEESDNDSDNDIDVDVDPEINTAKINKAVTKAARLSKQQAVIAMRESRKATANLKPEIAKATSDAIKKGVHTAITEGVKSQIMAGMEVPRAVIAAAIDANFVTGIPRIESKSDLIPVKGMPKVTIDAKGCSVRVRGWDKQEVQYSITQFSNNRTGEPIQMSEDHSDSAVNIKISNHTANSPNGIFNINSRRVRIDVFVPRRSNLKIISDGEIRLEGVSGELEVTGADESVNIRDSQGKLTVSNTDGRVRVIGFDGEVCAQTVDGDVYLEGKFAKLTGKASDGTMTLTLAEGSSAEITSNTDVGSEGFDLVRGDGDTWRLGSGGPRYSFDFAEGSLVVRNASLLSAN
jgi:hypothetical protein